MSIDQISIGCVCASQFNLHFLVTINSWQMYLIHYILLLFNVSPVTDRRPVHFLWLAQKPGTDFQ